MTEDKQPPDPDDPGADDYADQPEPEVGAEEVAVERSETEPGVLVGYEVVEGVATLTLDSQDNRNALSRQLVSELLDGLERAQHDDTVTVVSLRAEGSTFCSGADLREARSEGMERAAATLVELQRRILTHPKPVVARVHGHVRAGGVGIVAACDVALCAEDASFAFTEVRLGLTPAAISLTVLPRMTGRAAALAFLGGEVLDGTGAARAGLVTEAVPAVDLDTRARAVCASLAKGSPQGLRETKRLLAAPLVEHVERHGEEMAARSARLFGSEEAQEAMAAFLDRGA